MQGKIAGGLLMNRVACIAGLPAKFKIFTLLGDERLKRQHVAVTRLVM
jgi:hypothetical protein